MRKCCNTADVFEQVNHLPYGDNKKVQYIPSVAQIGAGVQREAIGDDFHYSLKREDNEEDVFDKLLRHINTDDMSAVVRMTVKKSRQCFNNKYYIMRS